jgi:cytosine/adenosine deaminase-related metal-dependent hydrolase
MTMARQILIRGATVVTMDKQGDLPVADVLVRGNTRVEIAPSLKVDDAELVDARGCIVIRGLVNAHMHTWQTALRGVADAGRLGAPGTGRPARARHQRRPRPRLERRAAGALLRAEHGTIPLT